MYNYEFVSKKVWKPVKNDIISMINNVQFLLKEKNFFTFDFRFIGSASRNMITADYSQNMGFDFDVNICPNDDEENFSPKELKEILISAFNQCGRKYGYDFCEDSTRVFTMKVKDKKNSKILHSVDFAIVFDYEAKYEYFDEENDEDLINPFYEYYREQKYIHFNKKTNSYSWEFQPDDFHRVPEFINILQDSGVWNMLEVKELYLQKKNANNDINKKSRSIYAETINEIYFRYFNN